MIMPLRINMGHDSNTVCEMYARMVVLPIRSLLCNNNESAASKPLTLYMM